MTYSGRNYYANFNYNYPLKKYLPFPISSVVWFRQIFFQQKLKWRRKSHIQNKSVRL